jgi:hypothetical protein
VVTVRPSAGQHFYYAKLTQDDGKVLWSAPVWVKQLADEKPSASKAEISPQAEQGGHAQHQEDQRRDAMHEF